MAGQVTASDMFKKFDPTSDVSTSTQVKASVQRGIKAQICDSHPAITEDMLDELIPKKSAPLVQYKVGPHLMLYCQQQDSDDQESSSGDVPVFFQQRDGPLLPTLKLVHKYRTSLPFRTVTVDDGAIPFLLGGAHIMGPGLTNVEKGSIMPEDGDDGEPGLSKGQGVVVYAASKEHAIAVGRMVRSSAEMCVINER